MAELTHMVMVSCVMTLMLATLAVGIGRIRFRSRSGVYFPVVGIAE